MYELYVLNKIGQQIYQYEGIDLGDTIEAAKHRLTDPDWGHDAEYAYIVETVIHTQQNSVIFRVHHKWFCSRKMLAEQEDPPYDGGGE